LIEIKDENESFARIASIDFAKYINKYGNGLNIAPPTEAVISKIKGMYRFQILIKSKRKADPSGKLLRKPILNSFIEFNQKSRYRDIRIILDIDPQSII
jgi:primosomal protein N'